MAQCPTCQGTEEIECPYCDSYQSTPSTITNLGSQAWIKGQAVFVRGQFQNKEDTGSYAIPTAEVEAQSQTYKNTTTRTYFPPNETTTLTISIEGVTLNDIRYLSNQRYILGRILLSEVETSTCPYCDGTRSITCPDCDDAPIDGGGSEPENGATPYYGGGGGQKKVVPVSSPVDWTLIGVGAVAAVAVAAVVFVMRTKVIKKDLRGLAPLDFKDWVVQRLSGKASSLKDSRVGIDAFMADGRPVLIRQSDNIGRDVIENFASVMGRVKAKNGVIVAFSFADDAIRGIVRARINYGVEIRKVTVNELREKRNIT